MKKEEQCNNCSYCDPDDIYDYKDDYDECLNVLYDACDLLKDILQKELLDDNRKSNIHKVMNDIKWVLR